MHTPEEGAQIIRKYIAELKFRGKPSFEIEAKFLNLIQNRIKKIINKWSDEELKDIEDYTNDIYVDLLKNIKEGNYLNSKLIVSKESDLELNGYLKTTIINFLSKKDNRKISKDSINIKKHIKTICDKLISEGKIKSRNKAYSCSTKDCNPLDYEIENSLFTSVFENGKLSTNKIEILIEQIICGELENYCIPFSYLVQIVINISGIDPSSIENRLSEEDFGLLKDENLSTEQKTEIDEIVDIWIERFKMNENSKKYENANLFLDKFYENKTFQEIIDQRFSKDRVGVSFVEYRIKKFINDMKFSEEIENESFSQIHLNKFMNSLIKMNEIRLEGK